MQYKDNGDVDKRTLGKNRYLTDGQMLPTKNGFVQMVYRPVQIANGCVSTKNSTPIFFTENRCYFQTSTREL